MNSLQRTSRFVPCLWFDDQAEEAAQFYTEIFENSKITAVTHYPAVGQEAHGKETGTVMTVEFELEGQPFTALNAGPAFQFNEAISFQVMCEDQEEVDRCWERLSEGGDESAQQCGWLKDKYGVSWQVVPREWIETMAADTESESFQRAFAAMMQMKKLDIGELKRAYAG